MAIEPATLPQVLIDLIGEYGLARTDGVGEIERLHRWELLIAGIKDYTASQMREHEARVRAEALPPMLSEADQTDLLRLEDLFSEGEGWDLPKARMQRLADIGVIRHAGAGRYCFTSFGWWCVGSWRSLPLETVEEANERSRREMEARNAALIEGDGSLRDKGESNG